MSETVQKVGEMLIRRLKIKKISLEQINEDTQLFGPGSLELDSIDVLELVVGLKKEFGVEIADRQTAEKVFTSVGAIARFIEEKQ
jgi:acyl carrier protein